MTNIAGFLQFNTVVGYTWGPDRLWDDWGGWQGEGVGREEEALPGRPQLAKADEGCVGLITLLSTSAYADALLNWKGRKCTYYNLGQVRPHHVSVQILTDHTERPQLQVTTLQGQVHVARNASDYPCVYKLNYLSC